MRLSNDIELMQEWDSKKNPENPNSLKPFSAKKVWWVCSFGHEWQAIIANRSRGATCPYCSGKKISVETSLSARYPDLILEWDFESNSEDPCLVAPFSSKQVAWRCKSGHKWNMAISSRTAHGQKCPYCSGKRPSPDNNLEKKYPEIAKQWNQKKNGSQASSFLPHSKKKVWWICTKGHEWAAAIADRTLSKSGCHVCSGYSSFKKPEYYDDGKLKKCHHCNNIKNISDFRRRRKDNQTWSDSICKACSSQKVQEYRTMTDRGIASEIVRRKRGYCKKHQLPFDLDTEWVLNRLIEIEWKCELSSLPMRAVKTDTKTSSHGFQLDSISVDRKDPNKGYTKDNVRFILNQVNIFRQNGDDERLYAIAEALLQKRKTNG